MCKSFPGEDGKVSVNKEIYINYTEEFYTDKYFAGLKSNTLRGYGWFIVGVQWTIIDLTK